MHMSLSKRTHIMLDPAVYMQIQQEAELENRTVGSFIRFAVDQELQKRSDKLKKRRMLAVKNMNKLRQQYHYKGQLSGAEIKALVNYGRKY